MFFDLKPCPFCGNETPFEYISVWTCALRCKCGIELQNSAVNVVSKLDEFPEELKKHAHPADLLIIKKDDGSLIHSPDHGYYGISCIEAFRHYGHLAKWNMRVKCQK